MCIVLFHLHLHCSSLAITLAIPTPTRPPKYLHAAPGDVHHFAHIRVTTTPCVYYFQRILGATLSRLPSRTRLTRHRNFGYTNALTTAKLSARSSRRCSSVSASPRGRRSLPSTSSNGSWVPPSRLPSRTRLTRLHGCTNLRDKGFETPFKLQQRILTIPLCPAFDQHRQNNKAILRGLRAKVYSAEPHNKGQICSRKPYWAWNEAE